MIENGTTFTLKEIAEASGVSLKTLSSRSKVLRQKGVFPAANGKRTIYYTYAQVKQMITGPKTTPATKPRPSHVALLKRQLQNDGYKINKEGKKHGDISGD